ncbi:unnamed protein product [Dicrocoelium dendriticum]|nr:unnamed protein product [Dicrocoelium dendriticum]
MIWYTKRLPLFTYMAHHVVVITGSITILVFHLGAFFAHVKLLTELSTPLLNLRWFVRQVGYPVKHPLFAVITLLMTVSFISVRIISSPPFWILIHRSLNELQSLDAKNRAEAYRVPFYFMCFMLDLLNLFWSVHLGLRCRSSVRDLLDHYRSSKNKKKHDELCQANQEIAPASY